MTRVNDAARGWLSATEDDPLFGSDVKRVFAIGAVPAGTTRGFHAHRTCAQTFVCVAGAIDVVVRDGTDLTEISLTPGDDALFVPPGLWSEQTYRDEGSVLIVLCDRPYEEGDYINDYSEYLAFRSGAADFEEQK